MLKEIIGVADDPPAKRRWFHDDYFDLFVWQADGEVTLFELCYGPHSSERALVWDRQHGFFHDGPAAQQAWIARFDEVAAALPEDIRRDIGPRIREFAYRKPEVASRRRRFRRHAWQR